MDHYSATLLRQNAARVDRLATLYVLWQGVCGLATGALFGFAWGGTLTASFLSFVSSGSVYMNENEARWLGLTLGAAVGLGIAMFIAVHVVAVVRLFMYLALAVARIESRLGVNTATYSEGNRNVD